MEHRNWSERTKQWVVIGAVVLLALAFNRFRDILTPLLLALILAYVLNPVVSFMQRRLKTPRTLAAAVVLLVLLGLISLIPILVIPALVQQVRDLNLNILEMLDAAVAFLKGPFVIAGFTIQTTQLYDQVAQSVQGLVSSLASSSVDLFLNLASGIGWSVIVLVLAFWFVKDAPYLRQQMMEMAPKGYQRDVRLLWADILKVWKAFFQGQLILCVVIGIAVAAITGIVGLPYALLMGLIAGVLEIVPNIGPVVAAIPAIIIALIQGSTYLPITPFWFAVLVAGLYVLIQQVENNVLVPRIMGQSLNLHPLLVLLGVLMGASLGGVLGIFLAAPALATLRVIMRYAYRKLQDEQPFPIEVEAQPQSPQLPVGTLRREEIQVVLFDLDGTLIDSDDAAIHMWTARLKPVSWLFRHRNPGPFLRHLIMNSEGFVHGSLVVLDKLGLDPLVFWIADRVRRFWRGTRTDFLPVEGIQTMLDELKGKYRLGVVTTRDRSSACAFLTQIGRDDLFEVVISREDVRRLKPHPEPVLKATRMLGVDPAHTLMVGDTLLDVKSGSKAGTQTVGVLCGLGMLNDFTEADLILATTSDLTDHLS